MFDLYDHRYDRSAVVILSAGKDLVGWAIYFKFNSELEINSNRLNEVDSTLLFHTVSQWWPAVVTTGEIKMF